MSQARRERRDKALREQSGEIFTPYRSAKRFLSLAAALIIGSAITFAVAQHHYRGFVPPSAQRITTIHAGLTLGRLLEMPPGELAKVDLAEMNLLCAQGLPGVADFDMAASLALLDQWTDRVDAETRRNWHRFKDNPAEYHHSEVEYRMGMLVTVLQLDCGVHFNPDLIPFSQPGQQGPAVEKAFFANPGQVFLTEVLSDRRTGSCASMPVLYAAIGRRLGYPVTLSNAKEHLFVRWDRGGGQGHVNIEGTGKGFIIRSDDDFKKWPDAITDAEIKAGQYLKSLTPSEELAVCLFTRGIAFYHHHRAAEALVAFAEAARLWPQGREWRTGIVLAAEQLAPLEMHATLPGPNGVQLHNPLRNEFDRALGLLDPVLPTLPQPSPQMPLPGSPPDPTFFLNPVPREALPNRPNR